MLSAPSMSKRQPRPALARATRSPMRSKRQLVLAEAIVPTRPEQCCDRDGDESQDDSSHAQRDDRKPRLPPVDHRSTMYGAVDQRSRGICVRDHERPRGVLSRFPLGLNENTSEIARGVWRLFASRRVCERRPVRAAGAA